MRRRRKKNRAPDQVEIPIHRIKVEMYENKLANEDKKLRFATHSTVVISSYYYGHRIRNL